MFNREIEETIKNQISFHIFCQNTKKSNKFFHKAIMILLPKGTFPLP